MPAAKKNKKEINLLPREEWKQKKWSRFLNWALTVGRYIVVFTELVVIIAFLSRFKLDRDLTDLYETIEMQQAQIKSEETFEKNFRFLGKRLSTLRELTEDRADLTKKMSSFLALVPTGLNFESLNLGTENLTVEGTAITEGALSAFIKNLQRSADFEEIEIEKISKGDVLRVEFSLKINFKEKTT